MLGWVALAPLLMLVRADVPRRPRYLGAWAAGLGELLENHPRRAELATAGLTRVHAEFAWPVIARQHLEFLEGILGE